MLAACALASGGCLGAAALEDPAEEPGPSPPPAAGAAGGGKVDSGGARSEGEPARPPSPSGGDVRADGAAPDSQVDVAIDGAAATSAPSAPVADVSKPHPGRVLPFIFIDVSQSIPPSTGAKIPGRLRVIEDHDGKFSRTDLKPLAARPVALETAVGINRHGNASDWYSDKKGYNVELRDAEGADRELPFVGLPPGSDFVLYACYNDKTCLRNVFSYDLGRQMGRWAPRTRFVEVALNGQYNGLYVVVERIRRDKYRVNIPKVAQDATGDLSGGYIWKVDSPVDSPRDRREWQTPGGLWWGYHHPKWDRITEPQRRALQAEVASFESVIKSAAFADPKVGYRAVIDVASFIDYLLVEELSYNVDGIWRSAYFHKQTRANGNKVYAGPLWDFDLAYGNADFREAYLPEKGWQHVDFPKYLVTVDPPDLRKYRFIFDVWTKLFDEAAFQRDFKCRWKELRAGPLELATISTRIDDWVKENAAAVTRDRDRWQVAGKKLFGNYVVFQTYAEDIKYFKDFLAKRIRWMDGKLAGANCAP